MKTLALQHQYTSCRRGHLGSAGFQTRACTEGLRPDEQREIERRGTYTPPRNAKQEPTRDEISQEFPRNFRYCALESGRWALTLSCYAGQDYSGRWGNYFAHSLIGDDGAPPIWPIDYYEWEGWKTSLSPDEDTEEIPAPLPLVDLTAIPLSESFTFAELKEFLREVPGREPLLADMLRAVFVRAETSRALVIRDSFLNGLFWIACLQKAVPLSCLKDLSFSTYQYDDRNCATINATTEGTEFQFNETQRKYQFFMFDFVDGRYSEVPKADFDYPEIVAGWMANDPIRLQEFHNFFALFDCQTLDANLVWAARLFQLSGGDGPPIATDELLAIIDFATRFTSRQGLNRVVELMAKFSSTLRETVNTDAFEALIRFFAEAARSNGQQQARQCAFAAWISMFDNLVFRRGSDSERVRAMRDELLKSFGAFERELSGLFLSENHMEGIRESLFNLDPFILGEILTEVLVSFEVLGKSPAWKQPEAKGIISAMLSTREEPYRSALRVFEILTPDTDALVTVCESTVANSKGELPKEELSKKGMAVGRALASVLAQIPADSAAAVRRRLDGPATWNILFGEWLELLSNSQEKRKSHEEYVQMSARHLPTYQKAYKEHLARSLMQVLTAEQQSQQAMQWISNKHIRDSSDAFVKDCLNLANLDIGFDLQAPGALKKANQLAETAEQYGVRLTPDRPFLLKMIALAQRGDVSITDLPLDDIQRVLAVIDPANYTVFLANFLRSALSRAKEGREHHRIVASVYNRSHFDRFKASYFEFLQERTKKTFTLSDEATLVFWLAGLWRDRKLTGLGDLEDAVCEILLRRIVALDEDQYSKLNRHMWNRTDELHGRGFEGWKWMSQQRGARPGSFLPGFLSRRKS